MTANLTSDEIQMDEAASAEIQPRRYGKIVRVLVIFSLLILFVPLYAVSTVIKTEQNNLQAELDDLNLIMSATPPVNLTREAAMSDLNLASEHNNTLKSVSTTLVALHIQWPSIVGAISGYDPDQVLINTISQENTRIAISGQANAELIVMAYAELLRTSGQFEEVSVQSINSRLRPTPTPAPTATPLPYQTAVSALPLLPLVTEPGKIVDFTIVAVVKSDPIGSAS